MNKEYVLVPKDEFQAIVEKYLYMLAGEAGGIDNWSWWGFSINDFIDAYNAANKTHFDYISDIIEDYIKAFKTIEIEGE
jgi:hypothetical protein